MSQCGHATFDVADEPTVLISQVQNADDEECDDNHGIPVVVLLLPGGTSSFRRLKDVLALRPIYHRVERRVKAHIFVAALALLVRQLLERRLQEAGVDLSAEEALQAVRCVRHVTFRLEQDQRSGVSAANARAQQVLCALNITQLRPPTPPAGEGTVM